MMKKHNITLIEKVNNMLERLNVLLELVNSFSFVENQYKITDDRDFYIDLLFKCLFYR